MKTFSSIVILRGLFKLKQKDLKCKNEIHIRYKRQTLHNLIVLHAGAQKLLHQFIWIEKQGHHNGNRSSEIFCMRKIPHRLLVILFSINKGLRLI